MKLYELQIQDELDEVFAISLVENPAIESNFMYFNEEVIKFAAVDNDKRILIGPILIPDKKILRIDAENEPYEVYFTKPTVKKLAQNYLKKKYTGESTLEHGDKKIKGVHLVESWIKEGKLDKSNNFGIIAPEGTWMGIFQIERNKEGDKLWNDYVKTGKVKGFSIEGLFSHKLVKASIINEILLGKNINELSDKEAEVVLAHIKAKILKDSRYKAGKRIDMESHSDYPEAVKNAAKRVLDWVEKNGWGSCGTPVGKQRCNQLAKGEPISVDTIRRIYSYVSRHEKDLQSSKSYSDGCGKLMMDSWGGLAAGRWAHNKLRELGLIEAEGQPSIPASSYPGEVSKKKNKYIHPALIGKNK